MLSVTHIKARSDHAHCRALPLYALPHGNVRCLNARRHASNYMQIICKWYAYIRRKWRTLVKSMPLLWQWHFCDLWGRAERTSSPFTGARRDSCRRSNEQCETSWAKCGGGGGGGSSIVKPRGPKTWGARAQRPIGVYAYEWPTESQNYQRTIANRFHQCNG